MNGFLTSMVTVLTAILAVAVVAVLVSKNSNTQGVTSSFWSGFNQSIAAAVSPVTGNMASSGVGGLGSAFGNFTSNMV